MVSLHMTLFAESLPQLTRKRLSAVLPNGSGNDWVMNIQAV